MAEGDVHVHLSKNHPAQMSKGLEIFWGSSLRDEGRQRGKKSISMHMSVGSNWPVVPKSQAHGLNLSKEKEGRGRGSLSKGISCNFGPRCFHFSDQSYRIKTNWHAKGWMDEKKNTGINGKSEQNKHLFFSHKCSVSCKEWILKSDLFYFLVRSNGVCFVSCWNSVFIIGFH